VDDAPSGGGWSRAQRGAHWVSAGLVAAAFALGWIMVAVPFRPLLLKFSLYQAHKTAGLLVLALAVWRLGLRRARGRAPWDPALSAAQRRLAALGHAAMYVLLLVVPVLGYLCAAAAPIRIPTLFLGVIPLPHAIGPDAALFAILRPTHRAAAIALVGLACCHAAMAIAHHRAGRGILRRMWRG
jgi:cytochrome b561